jgi:NinB protein
LWAALGDIARQRDYHGLKLSPDDWKVLFLDALDRETRMVPNLDGTGMVGIGRSSSSLSVEEFSGLLSIVYAWGSANGIEWSDKPDE